MQSTLDYLYSLERFGIKLGLETTQKMLDVLENPHHTFKSIHVTGTNGKGSTCAFLASILQEAGYKTGLYTSPHLVKFNERIKINGFDIPHQDLLQLISEIKEKCSHLNPTFFEFTTAMAFLYFARQKVDFAVIEVGMGGRLDATNVILPEVSIITNIGFDHMKHLGDSKEAIAREKAAIIKEKVPLVTAEQDPLLVSYFEKVCRQKQSPIFLVKDVTIISKQESLSGQSFTVDGGKFSITLLGRHQQTNAATAFLAVQALQRRGIPISESAIKNGLQKAIWPGRLQLISKSPLIMLDGAHNVTGMETAVEFLQTISHKKILILGIAADKEIAAMVKLIAPLFEYIIITQGNYKPAAVEVIAAEVQKYNSKITLLPSPQDAFAQAQKKAKGDELILVTGSLYLVGDILPIFE